MLTRLVADHWRPLGLAHTLDPDPAPTPPRIVVPPTSRRWDENRHLDADGWRKRFADPDHPGRGRHQRVGEQCVACTGVWPCAVARGEQDG